MFTATFTHSHSHSCLQVLEALQALALSATICYLGTSLAAAFGAPGQAITIITGEVNWGCLRMRSHVLSGLPSIHALALTAHIHVMQSM